MIARVAGAIAEYMCPARAVASDEAYVARPSSFHMSEFRRRCRNRLPGSPTGAWTESPRMGGRRTVSIEATDLQQRLAQLHLGVGPRVAPHPLFSAPVRGGALELRNGRVRHLVPRRRREKVGGQASRWCSAGRRSPCWGRSGWRRTRSSARPREEARDGAGRLRRRLRLSMGTSRRR